MADSNESAAVAHNLDQADKTQKLNGDVHAATEAHGGPEHIIEPSIAGVLNSTVIVGIAMAVLILIMIWKKVPGVIAGTLDARIAEIRAQLDEASKLRAEAEALKGEYDAKIASAARDAETLRAKAQEEAAQAIDDAKVHAAELVARRQKMAEDKIAAAERTAIADIRARAVRAATDAAASLIREHHGATSDKAMVDQAIRSLGQAH